MISILKGKRPKKPVFDATRGYTEELWGMTTSCWKEGPNDRPTVDSVLATLKNVAEESDSPTVSEHAGEPPTAPPSPDTFQLPVIEPLASTTIHHPEPPATVDSRTPYPPSDPAETAPSASPTTAGVPAQRTSNTRLTPDETLDRLLVRAKSSLGKDDARKLVEALEKVSRGYPLPAGRLT